MRRILIVGFLGLLLAGCGLLSPAPGPAPLEVPTQAPVEAATQAPNPIAEATQAPTESPTVEPTATPLPTPSEPFRMQLGSPSYLPAFTRPEEGCAWVGIAGQVFDPSGLPMENMAVVVKGFFNGQQVDAITLSGLGKLYGPGGYEVTIGTASADTVDALTIQLVNDKFESMSEVYPLPTYNDCQKNLILVNFQANAAAQSLFLPSIDR